MRSTSFEMVKLQNKTRDILVLQIQYVYIYSKKCIVCVLEIVLVIHNETIGLWLPNVLTKQSFFSNTFMQHRVYCVTQFRTNVLQATM